MTEQQRLLPSCSSLLPLPSSKTAPPIYCTATNLSSTQQEGRRGESQQEGRAGRGGGGAVGWDRGGVGREGKMGVSRDMAGGVTRLCTQSGGCVQKGQTS